jgi:hypothetical protein
LAQRGDGRAEFRFGFVAEAAVVIGKQAEIGDILLPGLGPISRRWAIREMDRRCATRKIDAQRKRNRSDAEGNQAGQENNQEKDEDAFQKIRSLSARAGEGGLLLFFDPAAAVYDAGDLRTLADIGHLPAAVHGRRQGFVRSDGGVAAAVDRSRCLARDQA